MGYAPTIAISEQRHSLEHLKSTITFHAYTLNLPDHPKMPGIYHQESQSMDSLTQIDIHTMLGSQTDQTQSPHKTIHDRRDPCQHNSSDQGSPRPSSVLLRPFTTRRTSTITWRETHETNSISVPSLLKKEVATSKAGHVKPVVEKFASWFKGSPEDLEELEEAREDDRKWKRKVRKWKRERRQSQDGGSDGVDEQIQVGRVKRLKTRLLCA